MTNSNLVVYHKTEFKALLLPKVFKSLEIFSHPISIEKVFFSNKTIEVFISD